jgi:transcriptional regulator with XRE-family HTH domain
MIENGEALPSLDTLEYLANRLDVPAGLFFSDSDETDALFQKADTVTKAKALYAEKRFDECADVCRSVPFDDELISLLAEALLSGALEDMKRFMLSSASAKLVSARHAAERSRYSKDEFFGTLDALEAFISFAAGDIDSDALSSLSKRPTRIPAAIFVYLTALSYLDRGEIETAEFLIGALPYLDADRMRYFKAKALARDFKLTPAVKIFEELYSSENLGFISKYRIAADIEACYENKRDFESAYKYSTIKHHILELFSK